jgi:hypothetical protein
MSLTSRYTLKKTHDFFLYKILHCLASFFQLNVKLIILTQFVFAKKYTVVGYIYIYFIYNKQEIRVLSKLVLTVTLSRHTIIIILVTTWYIYVTVYITRCLK